MNSKMLERLQIVPIMAPVDTNDGATTGDYVSLKGFKRCLVVVVYGDGTAASDLDLVLYQATTVAGAGAKVLNALQTGRIYRKGAADYATLAAAASTWEKITQATADEKYEPSDNGEEVGMIALEIMAEDLDCDGGFDCIRCDLTDPGAAKIAAGLYILGDPVNAAAPELMLSPTED